MSNDKHKVGKQDDDRVDANDPSEVEYLHRQYPHLSHETIKKAIETHGPQRANIVRHLEQSRHKDTP